MLVTDLAVIETAEVVPTLDELAKAINQQHGLVFRQIKGAIDHGIQAGEFLLQARFLAPRGAWKAWVEENLDISYAASANYIRIAMYRDIVGDAPTMKAALKLIAGQPRSWLSDGQGQKFNIEDAQKLRDAGWTYQAIGDHLGIAAQTVWTRLDPAAGMKKQELDAKRRRRVASESKAKKRQERAEAAELVGGGISVTFKAIRRAQIDANNLSETGATTEIRQAATLAYRAICRAEDEIAKILADA